MECKAKYLNEHANPRVVRLVGDGWPNIDPPNKLPKSMFNEALAIWPRDLITDYFITPGGFLNFEWPANLIVDDVKKPTKSEINLLLSAAAEVCNQFLYQFADHSLAEKFHFLTLGIDSECEKTGQQAELIMLKDLQTGRDRWTGKSYPTSDQESLLVCFDDLSSHLIKTQSDKLLVLGCHDLNLLSNRALANTSIGSWRNGRILEFRKLAKAFRPRIALQHPHTADTPRIWSTAWSGLLQALPSVMIYVGAGRWYNPFGSQRGEIFETLRRTARGPVSTILVNIIANDSGVILSKIRSTSDRYVPPKFKRK